LNRSFNIILLITISFVLSSCYNNSHIRTQRILEPGDKILSAYGSANIMGAETGYSSDDIQQGGIAGLRAGVSYLGYRKGYEQGLSIGYGGSESGDYNSYIFGYDIRKVISATKSAPYRYGLHAEFNNLLRNGGRRIQGGSVVQLRPYIMSTTSPLNNWYGGVHGLMSFGTIQSSESYWNHSYTNQTKIDYTYDVSSLGLGITVGNEIRLGGMMVQTQVDVSYISQQHEVDPDDYLTLSLLNSEYLELEPLDNSGAFASIGLAISQVPKSQKIRARIPVQYMNLHETNSGEPTNLKFDPFTGEALPQESSQEQLKFDPNTGLPIQAKPTTFDPFTGLPVDSQIPTSLLSPQERSRLLIKGLKIVSLNGAVTTALVQDVKNTGLVIYRESLGKPILETIEYKNIHEINFEGGRKGFKKSLNSAMVGCGICVALPLAGTILTGEGGVLFLGILGAPVVGLSTLLVTSLITDKYEVNFLQTNSQRVDIEYKKQILSQLVTIYVQSGFPDYEMTRLPIKP